MKKINNYIYVTLVSTKEYLKPALVLGLSLKKTNSKYPFLIMITEDIIDNNIKDILNQENILYEIVPVINYPEKTLKHLKENHPENITVKNSASKLNIFNLLKYDKIVYLDADSIVFQNIDILFNFPDGSLLYDGTQALSGLMVLCPNNHCYDYYISVLKDNICLDGNLIDTLWFQYKSNPQYRIPINICYLSCNNDNILKYTKAITFDQTNKLWHYSIKELKETNNKIYNLYGQYLEYIENKYFKS